MTKVITYGTFDLLHRGHVRLLERAKALGDRLVGGVTSDDYDRTPGVSSSLLRGEPRACFAKPGLVTSAPAPDTPMGIGGGKTSL